MPIGPQYPQISFKLQGFLVNENHKILDTAILTAQGPLPDPSVQDSPNFTHMEVNGFPAINENAPAPVHAIQWNNNILELNICLINNKRHPETGKLEVVKIVNYSMFIDRNTSEFLMCMIEANYDGTMQTYYFLTTQNTQIITDTFQRAHTPSP